ncbi:MAG: GspE/PulE family protein, partial [Asticcacaulis sp.]
MSGVYEPVPEISLPTARRLPFAFARAHGAVVMSAPDHPELKVGLREDADPLVLIEVRRVLGQGFTIARLSRDAFERQLSETYAGEGLSTTDSGNEDLPEGLAMLADELPEEADLLDSQDDAPVIRLINGILAEAARIGASDVHIEPFESRLMVRARVDGVLREMLRLNPRLAPLLVSRIKVMARLDIAEKRLPQDGRITLTYGGRNLDVRVSTLPAKVGERVVMRLLSRDSGTLDLTRLGMPAPVLTAFGAALAEPNGIVLITGPTGSGKTTTLYSGLSRLNDATRNILTIEDPVEYGLDGIGQTQVNTKVGMTFAAGLRAILRQDPDVVMVGEIRDSETAQIAV